MEIIPRSPDPPLRIGPLHSASECDRHVRPCECDPVDGTHTTNQNLDHTLDPSRVDWTTWWPWRGAYTRSHPELGREIPQRPWYCVSRHGRVGRRQVFQSTPPNPRNPGAYHHQRG